MALLAICLSLSGGLIASDSQLAAAVDGKNLMERTAALRAALSDNTSDDLISSLFREEARIRPSLRLIVNDPKVGRMARIALSMIADPQDIRMMVGLEPLAPPFNDDWMYYVACALLEPRTERERLFLRRLAGNEGLPAFSVSARFLQGENLPALALRTSNAFREGGTWVENHDPSFNKAGDKARVEILFNNERCVVTYTATFHRSGHVWRLRGIVPTLYSMVPSITLPSPSR